MPIQSPPPAGNDSAALVGPFMQMITGGWVAGAIGMAAEIHLADALAAGARTANEAAAETETDDKSLYRLMRFLASIGILRQSGEGVAAAKFELTDIGQLLRGESAPGQKSLRDAAIFFASHHCWRPWETCGVAVHSLKSGKPSFDKLYGMNAWDWYKTHPEDSEVFNRAMASLSSSMHAAAVEAYDFSPIGVICDIGGGHGHLLAQILARSPRTKGILYDLPHVVAGSRPVFEKFGVTARAKAEGGSFLEQVPAADAYTMSHILHDWDDAHCKTILTNCRKAVNPGGGGRVLILDAVIKPANEPDFGKLLDLTMLLVPGGRERTAEEFTALLGESGWKLKRIIPTKSSVSIVEGVAV